MSCEGGGNALSDVALELLDWGHAIGAHRLLNGRLGDQPLHLAVPARERWDHCFFQVKRHCAAGAVAKLGHLQRAPCLCLKDADRTATHIQWHPQAPHLLLTCAAARVSVAPLTEPFD